MVIDPVVLKLVVQTLPDDGPKAITKRLSNGEFDVLEWDPREIHATLPAASCYPYNAVTDRWSLLTHQYLEVSDSPRAQLELADAMNKATLYDLELGNSTPAAAILEEHASEYDYTLPARPLPKASSDELTPLIICADAHDVPQPDGLDWWLSL
ncbi:hypothetical protein DL765_002451 [Monosporascus sp. GIB2]|nr:hypothetical protein DL765_002451 [Monosporascus sp. GIB2]